MKLSVQLTRDLEGNFNVAVDSRLDQLTELSIEGIHDAVAAFKAIVELVDRIEKITSLKEEKS